MTWSLKRARGAMHLMLRERRAQISFQPPPQSPNTSPPLQVLWRLLWTAETTRVLLINWYKPPSLIPPHHSEVLGTLTALSRSSRDRDVTHGAEVASRKGSGKTFDWTLADFGGNQKDFFFTVKLLFPQLNSKRFRRLSFF